ncbi:MAG: hypothetical protein LBP28_03555 [Coriobacteriales bacterium]|jgi:hypothetical protein|nr:hypothetical protein [Coriobacteriales bacterium]
MIAQDPRVVLRRLAAVLMIVAALALGGCAAPELSAQPPGFDDPSRAASSAAGTAAGADATDGAAAATDGSDGMDGTGLIASEQEPADEREAACVQAAAQALSDRYLYGQAEAYAEDAEAAEQLFSAILSLSAFADPQTHRVTIGFIYLGDDVIAASQLGNRFARLLDYYYQRAMEATADGEEGVDSSYYQYAIAVCSGLSLAEAVKVTADYGDDLGALYERYDLDLSADNSEGSLDISGYRPAGTASKVTWQ